MTPHHTSTVGGRAAGQSPPSAVELRLRRVADRKLAGNPRPTASRARILVGIWSPKPEIPGPTSRATRPCPYGHGRRRGSGGRRERRDRHPEPVADFIVHRSPVVIGASMPPQAMLDDVKRANGRRPASSCQHSEEVAAGSKYPRFSVHPLFGAIQPGSGSRIGYVGADPHEGLTLYMIYNPIDVLLCHGATQAPGVAVAQRNFEKSGSRFSAKALRPSQDSSDSVNWSRPAKESCPSPVM